MAIYYPDHEVSYKCRYQWGKSIKKWTPNAICFRCSKWDQGRKNRTKTPCGDT
ncbi:hypothetical protein AI2848V1_1575 [Klebsiella pneumoniae]|nr:hypothetical protein AI2848V1_1575 [Klebsiella pneumoniae]CAH5162088.1 hypothetical protein AI2848V1_1575 [Klebsiella pneumoniae]